MFKTYYICLFKIFMPTQSQVKEDLIQEQILQAAKRLFAVHGLAKVTMDDVAKAIGKGRSSLYYYYKSKDEIFDAVVNVQINEMLLAMEKGAAGETTIEDKIMAFCMAKLRVVREKWSFFDALDTGMDADAISNFNKTKIVHHDLIMKREGALLTRILNEGIKNGELKAIEKDDMNNLIFVLLSCLHGLKREMRIENNTRPIEPAIKQFTRILIYGLKE